MKQKKMNFSIFANIWSSLTKAFSISVQNTVPEKEAPARNLKDDFIEIAPEQRPYRRERSGTPSHWG